MKSLKRLAAGILALGLLGAGTVLVAPAASAHANAVTGKAVCAVDGTYTVTWTIKNDFGRTETVNYVGHTPGTATVSPSSVVIAPLGSGTMTSTGIPDTETSASLTVRGTWDDGFTERPKTGRVELGGTCQPSQTPPSGSFTVECTATGAQADVGELSRGTATGGNFRLLSLNYSQLVTSGQQNVAVPVDQVIRLVFLPGDGNNQELDRHRSPEACPPPVVTPPSGSFITECTATGARADVGTLSEGTATGGSFRLVGPGGFSQAVTSGQQDVTVPMSATITLEYVPAQGAATVLDTESSPAACTPPTVTPPSGSFITECTATGARADVGTLSQGTATGGTFRLVGPGGFSQAVTSGQQDVTVPMSATITLEYVPAQGAATVLDSKASPAACPPPVVTPPTGSFTTECTETGARADVGPLSQGSATGGSFRLVGPGSFSQAVTSGQQDVSVPVSTTITLEYVPAQGAATALDSKASPAACPTPTVAPVRGLGVVKAVTPTGAVEFGDTLTYTLTVSATGTAPQTAVTVTDSVPSGTTYANSSASCDLTCTTGFSGGVVSWGLGGMAAGSTRTVSFQVTVDTPEADADGGLPAVTILNAGAVQSAEVPSTPSNEVETPVTAVLGTKTGGDDTTDDTEENNSGSGTGVLAATGASVPLGGVVSLAGLLILAGLALVAGSSRRLAGNRRG